MNNRDPAAGPCRDTLRTTAPAPSQCFEVAGEAEKIEVVPYACDQDRAKKHAHRATTSAEQARAANDRGRNRVQREGASRAATVARDGAAVARFGSGADSNL
jgi:hypothetical protein